MEEEVDNYITRLRKRVGEGEYERHKELVRFGLEILLLKTCCGKKFLYLFGMLTNEQSSCSKETKLFAIFILSSVLLILKYLL